MEKAGERIEIPLSKGKIVLILIGAIVFVALGIWFVIKPQEISNGASVSSTIILIVGIAAILFFGLCALYALRKLPDTKPGLIIDESGLTDNSSGVSAGQILWADIDNLSVISIQRQKLIMIEVKNPQDYIDKQTSTFKRKMMTLNYKMYGTPLSITSNGLKISFDELLRVITDKLNESR